MPVGDADQRADILVDHQNGEAAFLEPRQAAPDFGADQRRQAFGRLVENQQPRIGHQRAADRQHLLLAAGQLIAHAVGAFGEPRKQLVDPRKRPAAAVALDRGGQQVLAHGQVRKYLAAFRHQADAELGDPVGRQAADFLAAESDPAGARRRQPHDRAHGGGLAHAVAAHQRHHLAGRDGKRNAEQHLAEAVAGFDAGEFEDAVSHAARPPTRPRRDRRRARPHWRGCRRARRWRSPGHRPER